MFILQTVLEIAVAVFIIWGLFHEDVLVCFEDKIIERFKKRNKKSNRYHSNARFGNNDRNCA